MDDVDTPSVGSTFFVCVYAKHGSILQESARFWWQVCVSCEKICASLAGSLGGMCASLARSLAEKLIPLRVFFLGVRQEESAGA